MEREKNITNAVETRRLKSETAKNVFSGVRRDEKQYALDIFSFVICIWKIILKAIKEKCNLALCQQISDPSQEEAERAEGAPVGSAFLHNHLCLNSNL